MSHFEELAEKFSQINFTQMSDIELCRWLRKYTKIDIADSLRIAKVIRQAYNLGTIRSNVVNK